MAVGVPGEEVVPFLEADLADNGLVPFNPAGKTADGHPLSQLLRSLRDLLSDGDYPAVSGFLRNRDVLEYLNNYHHPHPNPLPSRERGKDGKWSSHIQSRESGDFHHTPEIPLNLLFPKGEIKEKGYHIIPSRLLEELDKYQNEHLPQSLKNMVYDFNEGDDSAKREGEFPNLAKAIGFLKEQVQDFDRNGAGTSLRAFLQTVYEFRFIDTGKVEDNDFAAVADLIDEALHLMSESPLAEMNLDGKGTLEILLWYLSSKQYFPEPEEAVIDLEGWMELPWNDAPLLIVTGMNDGSVPDSRPDDIFLPDTLRRQLNLPSR